jgi:hypothetical protein
MLIWGKREAVYFCAGDWTGSITLNGRRKFVFSRIGELREKEPVRAAVPAVTRKLLA